MQGSLNNARNNISHYIDSQEQLIENMEKFVTGVAQDFAKDAKVEVKLTWPTDHETRMISIRRAFFISAGEIYHIAFGVIPSEIDTTLDILEATKS